MFFMICKIKLLNLAAIMKSVLDNCQNWVWQTRCQRRQTIKIFHMTLHCICVVESRFDCTFEMFFLNQFWISQVYSRWPCLAFFVCTIALSVCFLLPERRHVSRNHSISMSTLTICWYFWQFGYISVLLGIFGYICIIQLSVFYSFTWAATRVRKTILFTVSQLWQLWQLWQQLRNGISNTWDRYFCLLKFVRIQFKVIWLSTIYWAANFSIMMIR